MSEQPRTVRIVSEGTVESTRVFGPDGQMIPNVSALRVLAEAGHSGQFEIELILHQSKLDVKGSVTELTFVCPFCDTNTKHECEGR